ncbi:MAG: tubulin-like doman-containing protein, partial [Armatimonadetes bacterium]|nr:tubulin-like doman-containing protein [Armatimonadota bacterium]
MAETYNSPTTPPANGAQTTAPTAEEQKLQGISRSLLIGVGGTGQKILLDVRERLIQKYDSLAKLPIVSFLQIDTDLQGMKGNANFTDAANLDESDKIHVAVHGVEQLRKSLAEYPHLREWLDPRTLSGDIHQGAGAVRARGRLAFFWNYDKIAGRILEEASEITKDSSRQAAMRNGLGVSDDVTVYIVGSLLGGTGSGMFLDVAYTVRELMGSQRNLDVVGIFTLPPSGVAVAANNMPNAYAGLVELNHYTDVSTTFHAQYKADQPGIAKGEGNPNPPFTYCYLVDMSSPKTNLGNVDKLVGMIGNSVFLDLTSEFQRQKKSNRDNFNQYLIQPDDLGCPQNYMSMGLSAIHFPKDKVIRACASRLCRQIVARWTEPLQKVANIGAFTEGEINRLGLSIPEVERQLQVLNSESGELIRDSAVGYWNNVNRQYEQAYPGDKRVVELLGNKQREHETRFVDTDPNPDILAKARPNLGEYLWGMRENLRALIPAKENALRGFISDCVNDPNRRHGVARAFLDQATERFRAFADATGKTRDASKETLAAIAKQRDDQLGEITRFANDPMLGLIMGARRREIDEKKDVYIAQARRWDVSMVDIRTQDAAVYFYAAMLPVLDRLKEEMDAYIERMKSLESFYRAQENDAIESGVSVNGESLFDRGRRVEADGVVTYEGGDIENRYAAYVGNGSDPSNPAITTASANVLEELGTAGDIYGIRSADLNRIKSVLTNRAESVFEPVEKEAVLDKFFQKYGEGTERSVAQLANTFALSSPFVHLLENAPNYKHDQNKEQTIVGLMNGAEPRSEAEQRFMRMLKDTVQGVRDGQISNANEQHQALFLRERAAFPLRILDGIDKYRFAYEQALAQGASANPIHTRKDIREWVRISPPSFLAQAQAWQTFCVGWAAQVIDEERDTRYTATGSRVSVKFIAKYSDRFGMPKTDPLGTF